MNNATIIANFTAELVSKGSIKNGVVLNTYNGWKAANCHVKSGEKSAFSVKLWVNNNGRFVKWSTALFADNQVEKTVIQAKQTVEKQTEEPEKTDKNQLEKSAEIAVNALRSDKNCRLMYIKHDDYSLTNGYVALTADFDCFNAETYEDKDLFEKIYSNIDNSEYSIQAIDSGSLKVFMKDNKLTVKSAKKAQNMLYCMNSDKNIFVNPVYFDIVFRFLGNDCQCYSKDSKSPIIFIGMNKRKAILMPVKNNK